MSGWLNLCNTVPDSSRPGNRPILKFTKYVYQVLTYYKAGRNLSETRLSSDVCRDRRAVGVRGRELERGRTFKNVICGRTDRWTDRARISRSAVPKSLHIIHLTYPFLTEPFSLVLSSCYNDVYDLWLSN